jgi:hypothetical protein
VKRLRPSKWWEQFKVFDSSQADPVDQITYTSRSSHVLPIFYWQEANQFRSF